MMNDLIYLDHNATTRPAPEVLEAMRPFLGESYGNPSSPYGLGREAAEAVAIAREQVARLVGSPPQEIVFTSGGTEGDNAALLGAVQARPERRHLVVSTVEHPAVLEVAESLEALGWSVSRIPVDRSGSLDLDLLRAAIGEQTAVVSIMHVNNETGVRYPVAEIAELARSQGALFHCDAVQSIGKIDVGDELAGADLVTISGHKLHGPKGVGALRVRTGCAWRPWVLGGGQQRGRRSGTENVPGAVGLGKACELAVSGLAESDPRVTALRDRLERGLLEALPGVTVHGAAARRAGHTSSLSFEEIEAEALLILLDDAGLCASSGSACSSGAAKPSHVLRAMNVPFEQIHGSIRFSLGADTTDQDIERTLALVPEKVNRLRALSPFSGTAFEML